LDIAMCANIEIDSDLISRPARQQVENQGRREHPATTRRSTLLAGSGGGMTHRASSRQVRPGVFADTRPTLLHHRAST
jgi:hypothetical protein